MTYTAHTKEDVPVLREKTWPNPKNYTGHPNNEYDIQRYLKNLREVEKHNFSLKSIPIHPDYVDQFEDGKDYEESEFEIKLWHLDLDNSQLLAIPKQKEENQELLWTIKIHNQTQLTCGS